MKIVLQRVLHASVTVNDRTAGEIKQGYLILLGIERNDEKSQLEKAVEKIRNLRIFPDERGKINLSIADIAGEILVISQFTLCADCKKGTRPGFSQAAAPESAEQLYEYFLECCQGKFKKVARGVFGAEMKVSLLNDGPFTLVL